ncbi:virulence factor family protein [Sinimarinibacterium sp. CAU 1509]|uniref:AcvB/VirJ family lysyl-phosphatidylglycerol hydrolase n=1 Tax=Sinimarinibacterium sp. CAU 1509 TaxID=2562283 RepID=UPI0010ABF98E|nr:AcvB/VirJ family lysyl-phosphatidylglycerol hydrolase [Sinimarinibacterium sp. CAU 1509]TJY59439.1 virulence factor family protein [Sinimarinibacterium sp. CAU 1509]
MSTARQCLSLRMLALIAVIIVVMVAATSRIGMDLDVDVLDHGRLKSVRIFSPQQDHRGFVLLLSDASGWRSSDTRLARLLADAGTYVAGIDSAQLTSALDADSPCNFADGDLENLSRFIQAYLHRPVYDAPLLVGRGAGAALAYATLAQAPPTTFSGALSIGFEPQLQGNHPPCSANALRTVAQGTQWGLVPPADDALAWTVMQTDPASAATKKFVAAVPGARMIELPSAAHPGFSDAAWRKTLLDAMHSGWPDIGTTAVATLEPDLPVTEVPATRTLTVDDRFALLLSGDGGWAGLDRGVAEALAAQGVPVAGLDTLRYFWTARTPDSIASDLDHLLHRYAQQWHRTRAIVIGYSQGANVLPAALNRLPPATTQMIDSTVLMGLQTHAAFEFHIGNWWHISERDPSTDPELARLRIPALCLYGTEEHDSACPLTHNPVIQVQQLQGGHHFDGDYTALASRILAYHAGA